MAVNPIYIGVGTRCKPFAKENRGNFLHAAAARRIIGNGAVFPSGEIWSDELLERARGHSHIVLVMANAIRLDKTRTPYPWHDIARQNIQRTELPTVVLGLGAQAPIDDVPEVEAPPETVSLLKLIAERSEEIAVRGVFTAEVLNKLGIKSAIPLGCQSSIFHGQRFPYSFNDTATTSRILFNYTNPRDEYSLIEQAVESEFEMIGQSELWEEHAREGLDYDSKRIEPLFKRSKVTEEGYRNYCKKKFFSFTCVEDWIAHTRGAGLSLGSRFHGNMVAVQAGVRALWFVHDSRTKELCEQLGLPNINIKSLENFDDVVGLCEKADMSDYISNYGRIYEGFRGYLKRAGIEIAI